MLKSNKSKFIAMLTIILLGLFSLTLLAQEKKDEEKSKLDLLKGKVEKITVKVDGKDVVFEGKEAEKLAKQLQQKKEVRIVTSSGENLISKGDGKVFTVKLDGDEDDAAKKEKKVKVEIKDGKKAVTVTTIKDGKEETKTYEGEDAEKFLKEQKSTGNFHIYLNDNKENDEDNVIYLSRKNMDEEGCCCCKGKKIMMHMSPHGKNMKHMIIKEFSDDDKVKEEKIEKSEKK